MIFNYVLKHPNQTRFQISHTLKVHHTRVSELLAEGLLAEVGKTRVGDRWVGQIVAVPENAIGKGRDRVKLEFSVFVNQYGEYSAECSVVGQIDGAKEGPRVCVAKKSITLMIPRSDEPEITRKVMDDSMQTFAQPYVQPQQSIIDITDTE